MDNKDGPPPETGARTSTPKPAETGVQDKSPEYSTPKPAETGTQDTSPETFIPKPAETGMQDKSLASYTPKPEETGTQDTSPKTSTPKSADIGVQDKSPASSTPKPAETGTQDTSPETSTPKAAETEVQDKSLASSTPKPTETREQDKSLKTSTTKPETGASSPGEIKATTSIAKTSGKGKDSDESDSEDDSEDDIELDADMLETVLYYLGEFGTYQKLLFVAMIPFVVFYAWVYFAPMFIVLTPHPFWCYVPQLSNVSKEMRQKLTTQGDWDGCRVYDTNWSQVLASNRRPPPDTPTKPCTTGWEFEYKEVPYPTVVSERGWVCDNAAKVPSAQSSFFAGSIMGGLFFGWMADKYGRVPALMGVNLLGGISGIASTYTRGVWDFFICRFFCGVSYDNCVMIAYILVLEYVGPSYRTMVATLPIALYYGASAVALPWIAYFIANWRVFTWVTVLPMFIVLAAPWTMPESARWLSSQGRIDDAVKVLRKFEKINKVKVPFKAMNAFIITSKRLGNQTRPHFGAMFKSTLLRATYAYMMIMLCICACGYDVIVRLSESFGLNFFITFTINAAAEIPSVLLAAALLDKLGRRNLTWGPLVISAVCVIAAGICPKGLYRVLFAVVVRFFLNLALTVGIQWCTEILPTPFRATGSSILHTAGSAISLMAPFLAYLERMSPILPFLIVSAMTLVAAVCSLMLPETKGLEMPQTLVDAEKIIVEYSLFRKPKYKDKTMLNKLRSSIIEPVHRRKEGRVSILLTGNSQTFHSRLNLVDPDNQKKPNLPHKI